jgi:hypothetical protein
MEAPSVTLCAFKTSRTLLNAHSHCKLGRFSKEATAITVICRLSLYSMVSNPLKKSKMVRHLIFRRESTTRIIFPSIFILTKRCRILYEELKSVNKVKIGFFTSLDPFSEVWFHNCSWCPGSCTSISVTIGGPFFYKTLCPICSFTSSLEVRNAMRLRTACRFLPFLYWQYTMLSYDFARISQRLTSPSFTAVGSSASERSLKQLRV